MLRINEPPAWNSHQLKYVHESLKLYRIGVAAKDKTLRILDKILLQWIKFNRFRKSWTLSQSRIETRIELNVWIPMNEWFTDGQRVDVLRFAQSLRVWLCSIRSVNMCHFTLNQWLCRCLQIFFQFLSRENHKLSLKRREKQKTGECHGFNYHLFSSTKKQPTTKKIWFPSIVLC